MPRLADLQDRFAKALIEVKRDVPEALTSHSSVVPRERFNIYRNNVYSSLIDILAARFPAVQRLVGEDFFSAIARRFVEVSPPQSPVMIAYGAGFASFLDNFEHVRDTPYLADVARLEWAHHEAYHAEDRCSLRAEVLTSLSPDEVMEVIFIAHPSLSLVASPYPIVSIWQTNMSDGEVEPVSLGWGRECALVVRPALYVDVYRIGASDAVLAGALIEGRSFGDAAQITLDAAKGFRLDRSLAQLLEIGAFAGYRLTGKRAECGDV